jgi:hypothetical protein
LFRKYFGTEAATFALYLAQKYSLSVGAVKELASSIGTIEEFDRRSGVNAASNRAWLAH